jgi:hypothetical protein
MLILADGFNVPDVPPHITHLFALILNPMRGRTEEQRLLAVSDSRDELKTFWDGERAAEPYSDGQWQRTYRAGPLEWFNPPFSNGDVDSYGNGIIEMRRDAWRRVA